jgi:hypothetical protein
MNRRERALSIESRGPKPTKPSVDSRDRSFPSIESSKPEPAIDGWMHERMDEWVDRLSKKRDSRSLPKWAGILVLNSPFANGQSLPQGGQ